MGEEKRLQNEALSISQTKSISKPKDNSFYEVDLTE